ncbi:MAG: hypothetical protein LBE83_08505 [Propionibacteriaceae bacterium]|nr:hypothetical protein [Propionibacteriaceae bacterium]
MINARLLVSGAEFFSLEAPINPYYDTKVVQRARALEDHRQIRAGFDAAGIEVVTVPAPAGAQDGVYTANWALVRDGRALLSRLPNARQIEEAHAERVLTDLGITVSHIPEDWHFSGQGDALAAGRYLLAGQGYRSDRRAQRFAAEFFDLELVQLQALPERDAAGQPVINTASGWPDSFFYDIDLAIAVLRPDLIAYCPTALDEASCRRLADLDLELIEVSEAEATNGLACNLVSTGDTVVMSANAPDLAAELRARDFRVITPRVEELTRGGGFIRCVSLTLD